MDFIFLGAGAANGYDALGHFLRTEGVGTICLNYAIDAGQRLQRASRHDRSHDRDEGQHPGRARGPRWRARWP